MARIAPALATDPLLDFPSEEDLYAARPGASIEDRREPTRDDDALSGFSREPRARRSEGDFGPSRSEALRSAEPSRPDARYSEFMRILERSDV